VGRGPRPTFLPIDTPLQSLTDLATITVKLWYFFVCAKQAWKIEGLRPKMRSRSRAALRRRSLALGRRSSSAATRQPSRPAVLPTAPAPAPSSGGIAAAATPVLTIASTSGLEAGEGNYHSFPLTVSPTKGDFCLQEQIKDALPHVFHSRRDKVPSDLDLQKHAATANGTSLLAASASAPKSTRKFYSETSSIGDPVDLLAPARIPVLEKRKWAVGSSPVFPPDCNEVDFNFNASNATSHQLAVDGGHDLRSYGRLHFGQHKADAPVLEEGGWSVVRPKFWWRKTVENLKRSPTQQQHDTKGTSTFKTKLQGKCYNCLSPDHFAFRCSAPTRCWQCLHFGHRARACPGIYYRSRHNSTPPQPEPVQHSMQYTSNVNSRHQQHQRQLNSLLKEQKQAPEPVLNFSPVQHNKSYLRAAQEGQNMEARYPGDPRARPSRAFCAISATGSIRRRRDDLISKAVVCSFDGNSHEVDTIVAGDMLREKFNLCHGQYQLVKHFPEQFFIIFPDARTKQWAIDRRSVSYRGREFHFGDWSEESYARKTSWEFRVKVRVEGIPVHCWGEEVASRALGRSCTIHYVQERSRRRERTHSFDLWAWCSDPCEISKEVWLTVSEPDPELPPISTPLPLVGAHHAEPTDLKKGHVHTLRNHIEVVEDLCFIHGRNTRGGPMNRKPRREFVWSYGVSDSAGEKRERSEEFRGRLCKSVKA
jgi:hypothetical protein